MPQFSLYVLGPPRLEVGGETVQISRRKAMALLVYLAVTRESHGRDSLATLLWPEYDQSRARADLRRTLSVLNRILGEGQLSVDRELAGIDAEADLWVDVVHFRGLLATCEGHDHLAAEACGDCIPLLEEAAALYQGDFMAGFTLRDSPAYDEWQFFQAEALRDGLGWALEQLVRCYGLQEAYESAIPYARQWVGLDPLHEPAHRQLMDMFSQAGRRNAALRQYRQCVRVLEEELGVPPSDETTALYERIRVERSLPVDVEEVSAPVTPVPELPAFIGEAEAVGVEQAIFVAREPELARMERHLAAALDGQGRVVLVAGEAGSGKTALVYEFARRAQEAFEELVVASGNCNAYTGSGAPYLPFREMLDLLSGDLEVGWIRGTITRENARRLWELAPTAIQAMMDEGHDLIDGFVPGAALAARIAGLSLVQSGWLDRLERIRARKAARDAAPMATQDVLFEQFANVLETLARKRPLLLIIDDAQWVDTASAGLLFHLSRRLAGNRVLLVVTYRPEDVGLVRTHEGRHPLEPVINELRRVFGEIEVDLSQVEGYHFVEALLDAYPNRLSETFRKALYHRTQGHALFTVELLREMMERGVIWDDDDGCCVAGPSLDWEALPARVEAVIEERIGRLDEGLRSVLDIASVEGERFTAQVVARVYGASEREVLHTLSQALGRRHRLVQEHGEVRVDGRFLSRYQFAHALFQRYLYDELSAGERRLLHGEIAATLEEIYEDQAHDIAVDLAHHYAQADKIEKAIEYGLQAGDHARWAYAHEEALRYYRHVLSLMDQLPPADRQSMWRLRALKGMGKVHLGIGDPVEAEAAFRDAIALGREMGLEPRDLVWMYHWLSEVLWWQGRCEEQIRIGGEGLSLLGDADAQSVEAALMNDAIGTGYTSLGKAEKAHDFIARTANLIEHLPYSEELRPAYNHIFWMYVYDRDGEQAMRWLHLFGEGASTAQDMVGMGEAHSRMGNASVAVGDLKGALEHFEQALEHLARTGDVRIEGDCLMFLSRTYLSLGDLEQAEVCVRKALETATDINSAIYFGWASRSLARILLCRGALEEAHDRIEKALQVHSDSHSAWRQAWSMNLSGHILLAQGKRAEARKRFEAAVNLINSGEWKRQIGTFPYVLASAEEAFDDLDSFSAYCARIEQEPLGDKAPIERIDSGELSQCPGLAQPACLADDIRWEQSDFTQWYLQPADVGVFETLRCDDGFESLSSDWVWQDPYGDCSFETGDGLEIRAASERSLWLLNMSAPRVLRPASENVAIQGRCERISDSIPAIGGLLMWKDEDNYLLFSWGFWGRQQVLYQGCRDGRDIVIGRGRLYDLADNGGVLLRLERVGDTVRALCSSDGERWFTAGQVTFAVDDPIRVGVCGIGDIERLIYPGAHPDGTAIRFSSFQVWGT